MFLSPFALDRTRPHRFLYPFPCVTYRLTRILYLYCLNYYFVCLSVLAEINQHNGKIFPDRYRWDFYGTLLVKVLYRAPSLITHTILRTDLVHEGARPRTSVSPQNCVWRQANIYQPQYLTTGDRDICHFLGLRCVFTRVPSYPTTHGVTVAYLVCVIYYTEARLPGRTVS